MQHQLSEGPLLDKNGNLCECGYAFSLVKHYDRKAIKAGKGRIKEWDYYYIGNNDRGVAFTIDDNSYMGLGSVSILDFKKKSYITKSSMKAFTNGHLHLPSDSNSGELLWDDGNYYLHFVTKGKKRLIDVMVRDYNEKKPFEAHFELIQPLDDTMVIATPFDKPKHFYYNQKINCQVAKGFYIYDDEKYEFSDADTRAVLDWGRGVWTYKNTWYWATMSGVSEGKEVGLNLGYGFGNTGAASENMLFYEGKGYKLEDVAFNIPKDENGNFDYMKQWTFTSEDKSIDLTFDPIVDRHDDTDVLIIKSLQHQVFGVYNGIVKVGGLTVKIVNVVSPAERVTNWW